MSKDNWLLYLQGGGQCYSKESCDSRDASMKSSNGYASTYIIEGIFDDDPLKSAAHDWNKVFIPYCTSDGWIGNASASDLTWGYEFRGQGVIRAAINDLVKKGLITSASRILLGGSSAGGRGMMNNADFLSHYLPGSSILGAVLDSPYYLDQAPYDETFVGFPNQTMEIYNRYNVAAIIPADCAAVYTDASGDGWKCIYGQYRVPFLRLPYVMFASQYDSYQLSNNIGENPESSGHYSTSAMDDYAAAFADSTRSLLYPLTDKALIHSWACYNHAVSLTSGYYSITVNGISQNDAVNALIEGQLFGGWIEACSGLFCGEDCALNAR